MAQCTNCSYKWRAKDIWKLGLSKDGKKCPNCQSQQFISYKDGGFLMGLGYVSGIAGLLVILFFPFYIKLSDKNETML